MPKIDLTFAELHAPLFLNGISFGVKLFQKQATGELKLEYQQDDAELWVTHAASGVKAIVPTANVASMTPKGKDKEAGLSPALANQHKVQANPKGAQVSTPHDHVFAGEGAGQTGAAKRGG
jgi:hypothetical protein